MVMFDKPKKDEEAIFNDAIEIDSPAERAAFIKSACADDTTLLARVEALLKVHFEDRSFLKSPPVGIDSTLDAPPLTEGLGMIIGRYKLLQLIGEGGFGVVYMAEQQEPIRRKVALKIIKLGMDTKQVIARFEAERQALAMMDHPNIARVLDAGATDTGRPYFVMELVKGIPITEYCDKNNLDTQNRLELFIDVCKAVQHAHQKGIIHRDIKPSNVMITLHDGKPAPKIIDFGIAKATQHRLTEKTLFTEYRQFIGTPEYMSPEQAEMSGLDIDTRTDIYSLGVLLYELLTGTMPFEADKLRSAPYDEIRRIIREDEPPKPSTRLSTLGEALTDIAKHRDAQPYELRRIVRGDMDWIVMKTLEKDRTRRYETANELATDIERHLCDEPVLAGPPSVTYRLHKFVRRHRTGVAAGLLVTAAMAISLCLAAVGFIHARQEQARTKAALQRAGMNFGIARDAVDEMTQIAKELIANSTGREQIRRQLLQKSQIFYAGFLKENRDDPAVHQETGRAYKQLGDIHAVLGEYEKAEQVYRNAIAIFEKLAAEFPRDPNYLESSGDTYTKLGDVLQEIGQLGESERAYRQAMGIFKSLSGRFPTEPGYRWKLASVCVVLGIQLGRAGQFEEALASYRQAVTIMKNLVEELPNVLDYQTSLAINLAEMGKMQCEAGQLEEGEHTIRQGILLYEKIRDAFPNMRHELWAQVRARIILGDLLMKTGRRQEADRQYALAREFQEELLSDFPDDPYYRWQLAWNHVLLGNMLEQTGRLSEAIEVYEEVLELKEKTAVELPEVPSYRLSLATDLTLLGNMLSRTGRLEEAEQHVLRAKEFCERLVADFPNQIDSQIALVRTHIALSALMRKQGRIDEANRCYDQAKQLQALLMAQSPKAPYWGYRLAWGWSGSALAYNHIWMGEVLAESNEFEQAASEFAHAIELEPNQVYGWYESALAQLGAGDSEGYRNTCASILEQFGQTRDADTAHWIAWTGILAPEAVKDLDRLVELAELEVSNRPEDFCRVTLGATLYRAGRFDEAIAELGKALSAWEKAGKMPNRFSTPAYTWFFLAMANHQLDNADQAQRYFELAIKQAEQEITGSADWNRKLTLQLLRAEAQSLLGVSEKISPDGRELMVEKEK